MHYVDNDRPTHETPSAASPEKEPAGVAGRDVSARVKVAALVAVVTNTAVGRVGGGIIGRPEI